MTISAALIIAPYYMAHPDLQIAFPIPLNLREILELLSSDNLSFVFIAVSFRNGPNSLKNVDCYLEF